MKVFARGLWAGSLGLAVVALGCLGCGAADDVQLDAIGARGAALSAPTSVLAPDATIEASVTGTFRGGFFSKNTPGSPPAYDRDSQRVFSGSDDREAVDVIDISDPYNPTKLFEIDVAPWGGEPQSMDASHGLLAVSVRNRYDITEGGYVLLFNVDGELLADPVWLIDANRIRFTNNGRALVVTMTSSANDAYTFDPEGGVGIIDLSSINWGACRRGHCNAQLKVDVVGFTDLNSQRDALVAAGVRITGPGATVAQDLEIEGLSISHDSSHAWVTFERNNAIGRIDLQTHQLDTIFTAGTRDHSQPGFAFDASDRDGINIANWPVHSFAEPDGIAEFHAGGRTFLVTGNEGDPRDSDGFSEKARLKDLTLDPTVFPNAAALQNNKALGRLQVSRVDGDYDNDGDLDDIFMIGSRSLSVYTDTGELLFDSGDDFEQITAAALPDYFNCAEDDNEADKRSDDRGPEPEHITTGSINGRTYVFVVFERIGGFMIYDITDPYAVSFVQYVNNRNFAVEPKDVCGKKGGPALPTCYLAGDLEPEGVTFVSQADSPINAPLLVINHELSDTVTVYRLDLR